mmetsp:Transcript_28865/g.74505  ORF Transcript_28865/g.74505 Transcript_28865/m.74505 type:complete len:130 (+) Transcript_28865:44-433(+)
MRCFSSKPGLVSSRRVAGGHAPAKSPALLTRGPRLPPRVTLRTMVQAGSSVESSPQQQEQIAAQQQQPQQQPQQQHAPQQPQCGQQRTHQRQRQRQQQQPAGVAPHPAALRHCCGQHRIPASARCHACW